MLFAVKHKHPNIAYTVFHMDIQIGLDDSEDFNDNKTCITKSSIMDT